VEAEVEVSIATGRRQSILAGTRASGSHERISERRMLPPASSRELRKAPNARHAARRQDVLHAEQDVLGEVPVIEVPDQVRGEREDLGLKVQQEETVRKLF